MHFVTTALGGYLTFLLLLFGFQRTLLYPADRDLPDPGLAQRAGFVEVTTRSDDGLTLRHWYRPPASEARPVLVVFHGNAGHRGDRVEKLRPLWQRGYGVMLVGYRGYGGNPGRPKEEDLTGDARKVLAWLKGEGIPQERLVLYGESLGTGLAVKLASRETVAALVLEAPYTSIAEVAQSHYWYVPARWLVLDKWNAIERAGQVKIPVLVLHGARDGTIPPRFGRRLYEAVAGPKEYALIVEGSHNDLYDFAAVPEKVISFLDSRVRAEKR